MVRASAMRFKVDDRDARFFPRGRWRKGAVLLALIILVSLAVLAAADGWMIIKDGAQRCGAQFPKWLGCVVANHENLSGGLIAAGGALFAAWVAWHAVMDQIESEKELARNAVRPLANVPLGDYESSVFIKLTNNGMGPMIIKSVRITNAPDPSRPLIDAMPKLQRGVWWTRFIRDVVGRSILPGGEIVLLELSSKSSNSKDQFALSRDQVRQALGKLEVHVEYTDIYGSTLPIVTRSLQFFHRAKGHDLS